MDATQTWVSSSRRHKSAGKVFRSVRDQEGTEHKARQVHVGPRGLSFPCLAKNQTYAFLKAEDQWEIFTRKHGMEPRELFNAFVLGDLREWARRAEVQQESMHGRHELHLALQCPLAWILVRILTAWMRFKSSASRFGSGHRNALSTLARCPVDDAPGTCWP